MTHHALMCLCSESTTRLLIFNCTSGRSGEGFLATILDTIDTQLRRQNIGYSSQTFFDHVIFCTNVTYIDGRSKPGQSAFFSFAKATPVVLNPVTFLDFISLGTPESSLEKLTLQHELAAAWSSLVPEFPASDVHVLPSIQHAIGVTRSLQSQSKSLDVLVCGSLHLVGGVIEVADLAEIALRS
jgi:folylpolyglutamate synthase